VDEEVWEDEVDSAVEVVVPEEEAPEEVSPAFVDPLFL